MFCPLEKHSEGKDQLALKGGGEEKGPAQLTRAGYQQRERFRGRGNEAGCRRLINYACENLNHIY